MEPITIFLLIAAGASFLTAVTVFLSEIRAWFTLFGLGTKTKNEVGQVSVISQSSLVQAKNEFDKQRIAKLLANKNYVVVKSIFNVDSGIVRQSEIIGCDKIDSSLEGKLTNGVWTVTE
jgi:hypothetical protein